jgi:hypothetical protein
LIPEPKEESPKLTLSSERINLLSQDSDVIKSGSPKVRKPLKKRNESEIGTTKNYKIDLHKRGSVRVENYSTNKSMTSETGKNIFRKIPTYQPRVGDSSFKSSRIGEVAPKPVSLVQKASDSFKRGFNMFLQNTGNILRQVKNDMAQEDFSISNAFKK